MNPLGSDSLGLYGVHWLDFIRIAAATGCRYVSVYAKPLPFPEFTTHPPTFQNDAQLRRDTVACLNDNGVAIGLMDGFSVRAGQSVERYWPLFDVLGELGIARINTSSSTEALERVIDQIGLLAEKAKEYGVTVTIETIPIYTIGSLSTAIEVINTLAMPNLKLLVDTMHVTYGGGSDLIARIDPQLIDYVQICDGKLPAPGPDAYMDIAVFNRMVPGEGDFPLIDMLSHVRSEVIVSNETPLHKSRLAGVSDLERARMTSAGAQRVIAAAHERRLAQASGAAIIAPR